MTDPFESLTPWPLPVGRIAFGPASTSAGCDEPAIDPQKLRALSPAERQAEAIDLAAAIDAVHARERADDSRIQFAGPEPLIEALTWLDAATTEPPDADERVLIWIADPDGATDWDTGFYDHDDGAWRLCESGGKADGAVLYFARPEGPST